MIFSLESRTKVKAVESRWLAKFILRVITLVLAIISLIVFLVVWVKSLSTIWMVIPIAFSITWNLANVAVRMLRTRPVHPGANVACDLLLWLVFVILIPICVILNFDYYDNDDYYGSGYSYGYDTYSSCSSDEDCNSDSARRTTLNYAAIGIAGVVTILHFILFCWACADESKRRGSELDNRAAAMAATMVQQMQQQPQWSQHPGGMQYPAGAYQSYPSVMPQVGAGYPVQQPLWNPTQQAQMQPPTGEKAALGGQQYVPGAGQQSAGHNETYGFFAPPEPTTYTGNTTSRAAPNATASAPAHATSSTPRNFMSGAIGNGKERATDDQMQADSSAVTPSSQASIRDQASASKALARGEPQANSDEPGVAR